jgi:DNA-binding response OmpR family regulator
MGFTAATDVADYLAKRGVPFRKAHEIVGELVLYCEKKHKGLEDLTLKEFELLRKLMENPGQAFSRPQLLGDIWDITFVGETRTVDTHIQTLRRKLNDAHAGSGDLIQTVRGVGYRMSGEHS